MLVCTVGGNHEAANHLWELYYGGWVAKKILYMGHAGVINFGGVRIGGLSGIYNGRHYRMVRTFPLACGMRCSFSWSCTLHLLHTHASQKVISTETHQLQFQAIKMRQYLLLHWHSCHMSMLSLRNLPCKL